MAKIYAQKKITVKPMHPKPDTVRFLLNYSKALTMKKVGNVQLEIIAN